MSYGLRRYVAIHRLWWFVFFILCLLFAWHSQSFTHAPRKNPELIDLRKTDFWTGLQGIGMTSPNPERSRARQDQAARPQPGKSTGPGMKKQSPEPSNGQDDFQDNLELVSGLLLFLIRAGIIFLELRLIWLVVQYAGRYLLQLIMSDSTRPEPLNRGVAGTGPGPLFPGQAMVRRS